MASLKLERATLLHMSESFRRARKFKGLMIRASLERLGGTIATALIDPGQDVGVLIFVFPMLIRPSRQFIEVLCDGLFEFGRDADDTRDIAGKNGEAKMF
jgi:hypothetical protein